MEYGICILSVVPCRAEANDKSEIVSQLLFGELVQINEQIKSWYKITTVMDQYSCFIDQKQIEMIDETEYKSLITQKVEVSSDLVQLIQRKSDKQFIPVLLGSSLYGRKKNDIQLGKHHYHFEGSTIDFKTTPKKAQLEENALMYLYAPYLWGGRSPFGIDCSGFVQMVYKMNNIILPRDAKDQAKKGQTLSFIEEAEIGDLAFFDNEEGEIIHVGIMLANNQIIHSSGQVRIDRIDHQGIFNVDTNKYSHRLRIIKSVI